MPPNTQTVMFRIGGGWATDFGTSYDAQIGAGQNEIPFLLEADNCRYELDGSIRKFGGTTLVNSAAVGSGADITGVYDFWEYGAGLTGTQKLVGHVGTVLYNFTGSANLSTGLTANAIPDYTTFDDFLIYTSNADAPRSYNSSTGDAALSGAPNFGFSVVHKNRIFAAGVAGAGSTVYWSAADDPTDWSGFGSGAITVNPDDGDIITAIASFRGELWIFKGPHNRSIHRLIGSSPGSTDPFRLELFARNVSAAAQRLVFQFGNDLGFMDVDGAVHSLRDTDATASSYLMSSLSLPINSWLRSHVVFSRMKYAVAAVEPQSGYVAFTLTVNSGTSNNQMLLMDYRFNPPRWSRLPAFKDHVSLATVIDPTTSGLPRIMAGGGDGFLRRFDTRNRTLDGTGSYSYNWKIPQLNFGDPFVRKQIDAGAVGINPHGTTPIELRWKRDGNPWQSYEFDQSGGDILGPTSAPNPFILSSATNTNSILGSGNAQDVRAELVDGGSFHSLQFEVAQHALNGDAEVHHVSMRIKPSSYSLEN